MPSDARLPGGQWVRHNSRMRALQRWQLAALFVVCIGSLSLALVLGRGLISQSERQARAASQNTELLALRDLMRTMEASMWRGVAEGTDLPLDEFALNFAAFRQGLGRLANEGAGGSSPDIVEVRQTTLRAVDSLTAKVAQIVLSGSRTADALALTDRDAKAMNNAVNAWVRAASAESRAAAAASQSISRRLMVSMLGLMGLLGLGGLWLWFASERSRNNLTNAIRDSEERFRSLVQNSSDAVMVIDRDGGVRYVAPSVERMLGYEGTELLGRPFANLVAHDQTGELEDFARDGVSGLSLFTPFVWQAVHHDGSVRHIESIATDRFDDAAIGGLVLNSRDITDRHEVEQQLAHRAFHDPLTELANRALFENRVGHALEVAAVDGRLVAVVLIDLDDFKTINDSLGHAAGDVLIVEMARRLRTQLRGADTAARLGGDEFVVLVETAGERAEVEDLAQRLVDVIRRPTVVEGRELIVQASMGIASAAGPQATAASLLQEADVAMYQAKERGRAGYVVYDPSMAERVNERLGLLADLHWAMERDELWLAYQPIVAVQAGHVCGVEALLRWDHPTRGRIEPATFVPLAEENGQILQIGAWVLATAMREINPLKGSDGSPLTLAVNVSIRQLEQADFAGTVSRLLATTRFPARRLTLEITESALMRDPETMLRQLSTLKSLGIRIAIDDFGTGYSSLAYLARLPIDLVKIDRSFIASIASESRDSRIARMITGIGDSLTVQTVAEGVERAQQLAAIVDIGCDMAQGYYFGAAVASEQLPELLRAPEMARSASAGPPG